MSGFRKENSIVSSFNKYKGLFPDYEISLCNINSEIIASTNPDLLGITSAANLRLLSGKTEVLAIDDKNNKHRKDIVLRIRQKDCSQYSILVSGDAYSIDEHADAFLALVEFSIMTMDESNRLLQKEKDKESLVNKWLSSGISETDMLLREQLEQYGFMTTQEFTVVLMAPVTSHYSSSGYLLPRIQPIITSYLNGGQNLLLPSDVEFLWITSQQNKEDLRELVKQIESAVYMSQGASILMGVGRKHKGYLSTHKSYEEAKMAFLYAKQLERTVYFEDSLFEISLNTIPDDLKMQCIKSTFQDCTFEEIRDALELFELFIDCNGSINTIAQRLYIHKNTVQYRLKKIRDKTGIDIRKLNTLVSMHQVYLYFHLLSSGMKMLSFAEKFRQTN